MALRESSSGAGARAWPAGPLRISIAFILAGLAALSALAWLLTARQSSGIAMVPGLPQLVGDGVHDRMAMVPMAAPLFIGMWVTMMIAMMFPSVAPMVVVHWRLSSRREQGPLAVPLFAGGYLVSWTVIGIGAYWAYRGILALTPDLSARSVAVVGGGIIAGSGAYQLTRFKSVCLTYCRNPLEFFLRWKAGLPGALRMGAEHGAFCVGCCWGLMVVLFVLGLMNLAWMGVIAAVIFVEKVTPFGWGMARIVGVLLIAAGSTLAVPALFGVGPFGG